MASRAHPGLYRLPSREDEVHPRLLDTQGLQDILRMWILPRTQGLNFLAAPIPASAISRGARPRSHSADMAPCAYSSPAPMARKSLDQETEASPLILKIMFFVARIIPTGWDGRRSDFSDSFLPPDSSMRFFTHSENFCAWRMSHLSGVLNSSFLASITCQALTLQQ